MKSDKDGQIGSVLITTLWIMAILFLLAMGIGLKASLEMRLSRYSMDALQARYLARAGIVKAQELLSKDTNNVDTLYECGILLGPDESPSTVFSADSNKLGNGTFSVNYNISGTMATDIRYGMIDEERKININMSKTTTDIPEFRRILRGLSTKLTDEVINAIIDWQDMDEIPMLGGGEDSDYYQRLDRPYECKNKDFESLEELLAVKGMTQEILADIKDYITVYSDGKVNANTASSRVLNAIIGNDELVGDIVRYRNGPDGIEATRDDNSFADLSSFVNFPATSKWKTHLTSLANYFTVGSNNFRIISHGTVRRITRTIENVANRAELTATSRIKYYHEE